MPSPDLPFPPMEAKLVAAIPEGDWQYEPKWDGFRAVIENLGAELAVWSRNGRPLLRYFPELEPPGAGLPPRSALDGEVVLEHGDRLEFDLLQMRLHPAESRVRKLAAEIPARFIAFDLLLWEDEHVWRLPLEERRSRLEALALPFAITAASRDPKQARVWLERLESSGLDGIVCKRLGSPYLPGSRDAVVKVKHHKTADCVVAGVRWKSRPKTLATLLLGLYDGGELRYVGSCAVAPARHDATLELVRPLLDGAPERGFSEPNRWGTGELEESALRPQLVCEVRYDKVERHRFRHGTKLVRFRPDKEPAECTWEQVRPRRRRGDPTLDSLLA